MKTIHKEKYRQIGLKIAYYRKLRGLTQEELAESCLERHKSLDYLGFIPEVRLPNYFSGAVILFPFLGNCCVIPASCSFAFHIKMFSM